MDEDSIEASLELYKTQLSQVNQALQASGENDDLLKLKLDLQELINLTEESLLSLKKSNLLKSLEQSASVGKDTCTSPGNSKDLDEEYAAFQALLSEDVTPKGNDPAEGTSNSADQVEFGLRHEDKVESEPHMVEGELQQQHMDEMKQMIGMKCRAPYVHDWGSLNYHNAIISEIVDTMGDLPKVSVMFCNPTHASMLPCKYHLEGNCKFSDQKCRFSHGHQVQLDELREYLDPDYSLLTVGTPCLAKYDDDIWYKAVIVDLHDDHQFSVTMDTYDGILRLDLEHIVPVEKCSSDEDDSDDDEEESQTEVLPSPVSEEDDEIDIPVYLWKPPKSLQALGAWEVHTKGIASKLMAKMGYVVGQGLGKREDGRVEPVPIQLYPPGKSLDTIMQLKEMAGEQNLFDVMKNREKKQKAQEKKQAQSYHKMKKKVHSNVFDFINKKLGGKKGSLKDLVPKEHRDESGQKVSRQHRHITEQDLKDKSDRSLNIQLLKTDEEIKNVKKELERLKESLARNQLRDKSMANQVRQKIVLLESYLQRLTTSGNAIQQHKQKRSGHKKLTVF